MLVSWFLFPLGILKCPLTHLTRFLSSDSARNMFLLSMSGQRTPLNCIFIISNTIIWSNMHYFSSMLLNVIIINMHFSISVGIFFIDKVDLVRISEL